MNYITGSSRHQTYFATLDEQVLADKKRGVYYQDFYD